MDRCVFGHHHRNFFPCAKSYKKDRQLVVYAIDTTRDDRLRDDALVEGWFADGLFHFEAADQGFESFAFFLFGLRNVC